MKSKTRDQLKALEDAKSLMTLVAGLLKRAGEPTLSMQTSALVSKVDAVNTSNAMKSIYSNDER